jgi:hypothetical protein
MAAQSRVPSSAPVIGIVLLALAALVVVLVAGGPDRWAAAAVLLIFVPLQIAMGGALDEARRVSPPAGDEQRPRSAMVRTSLAVAGVVRTVPLVATVLLIVFAVRAWADGEVVVGSVLVVVAAVGVWRGWRTLRPPRDAPE